MASALSINYLYGMMGKVYDIRPPYRCVVTFLRHGTVERALLRVDKLVVNGESIPKGCSIYEYLQAGSMVLFSAHEFDSSGPDQCGWFVTNAWRQDDDDLADADTMQIKGMFLGIYNAPCTIVEIAKRQGVLTFCDNQNREQRVLFQASKVFLFSKRVSSKHSLRNCLVVEDSAQFDAIPCDPNSNDSHCSWFATLVWKGKKPDMDYDLPGPNLKSDLTTFKIGYKMVASNPKSLFVRGKGRILEVLTEEYGLALAQIQPNMWESVLFHRKACFLFKLSLANHNLKEVFKEGDHINFIAAAAPNKLRMQWVATQVSIDVENEE